jgi:hypothetical protein
VRVLCGGKVTDKNFVIAGVFAFEANRGVFLTFFGGFDAALSGFPEDGDAAEVGIGEKDSAGGAG